jgi:hypothetical protein
VSKMWLANLLTTISTKNERFNLYMGILTKMSQLGHYESIRTHGNVHWERDSRVNTRELPSLTRFGTRGMSSR